MKGKKKKKKNVQFEVKLCIKTDLNMKEHSNVS